MPVAINSASWKGVHESAGGSRVVRLTHRKNMCSTEVKNRVSSLRWMNSSEQSRMSYCSPVVISEMRSTSSMLENGNRCKSYLGF